MVASGMGNRRILLIGEAPGEAEDARGEAMVGPSGQFLEQTLRANGILMYEDCWKTYALQCRPPKGKQITDESLSACRTRVIKEIETLKPHLIILLGKTPLSNVLLEELDSEFTGAIASWRGRVIPFYKWNCWVAVVSNPAFVLKSDTKKDCNALLFKQDIAKSIQYINKPLPAPIEERRHVLGTREAVAFLSKLIVRPPGNRVAYDYEGTGLKPHAKGHGIVCVGLAVNESDVYSFLLPHIDPKWTDAEMQEHLQPEEFQLICLWRRFLASELVKKTAHHLKFEHSWSKEIYGTEVRGWEWCSMEAAHILDNTEGTNGLKFLVFVEFGITDYNADVSQYLKSSKKEEKRVGKNAINRIHQCSKQLLLEYVGGDALYQWHLGERQRQQMETHKFRYPPNVLTIHDAYDLFHEGAIVLAEIEAHGVAIDTKYSTQTMQELNGQIEGIKNDLKETEVYKAWYQKYGFNTNVESGAQLADVLYNILGLTPTKMSESGEQGSTDHEAVAGLIGTVQGIEEIARIGKLRKISSTYLGGYLRESVDGIIHPFFHLHIPRTFRSCSRNPNFQNVPKRDYESMSITRRSIIPRPGHVLVEIDFSNIEVRISACYHNDKQMIIYIKDPTTDMHRDQAIEVFKMQPSWWHGLTKPQEKKMKPIRHTAKNKFVFPQFYGDYFVSCAQAMWQEAAEHTLFNDVPLLEHMRSQGIGTLESFTQHMKEVEHRFWHERFPEYTAWKEQWYKDYIARGWFIMKTGFKSEGLFTRNEVINHPVQGPAFHCLLWSVIQMHKELKAQNSQSRICAQIHDSMFLDADPDDLDFIFEKSTEIMTQRLVDEWKWITVPLAIEHDVSRVDGTWQEQTTLPWDKLKNRQEDIRTFLASI